MTAVRQRAINIINVMPEAEVEKFVTMNVRFEKPEVKIDSLLQEKIDNDIEKTQQAIAEGCEMLSVDESYARLKTKYGF